MEEAQEAALHDQLPPAQDAQAQPGAQVPPHEVRPDARASPCAPPAPGHKLLRCEPAWTPGWAARHLDVRGCATPAIHRRHPHSPSGMLAARRKCCAAC